MPNQKEFKQFAVKGGYTSTMQVDAYIDQVTNMTRSVIEERPANFREIDVFSRLIMDRIIFLGSEVEDNMANIIIAQLLFLASVDDKKDVLLYINSPGGSIYPGLGIYDTMQYITPQVCTVCTGLAASMAAVLLAGGAPNKRAALPHARIMIHQPMGGAKGKSSDMEITIQQILELKKDIYHIIANHTGQAYESVERHAEKDYWMRSAEAKTYGIIDQVLHKQGQLNAQSN